MSGRSSLENRKEYVIFDAMVHLSEVKLSDPQSEVGLDLEKT